MKSHLKQQAMIMLWKQDWLHLASDAACCFVLRSRLAPNQEQYGQNEILKAIFGALKGYNDAKSQ